MKPITERLDQGVVTARSVDTLRNGELRHAIGVYYKPDDPKPWKINGRSVFGDTGTSQPIDGLLLTLFDGGIGNSLLCLSGGSIWSAPPGRAGAFAELIQNVLGEHLEGAHAGNKWYICTGGTQNFVLKADGTTRPMGMAAPPNHPTYTPAAIGGAQPPTGVSVILGPWFSEELAIDGDVNTSAGVIDGPDDLHTLEVTWAGAPLTVGAEESARVILYKAGSPYPQQRVRIELSEDGGTNFSQVYDQTPPPGVEWQVNVPLTAGTAWDQIRVRINYFSPGLSYTILYVREVQGVPLASATPVDAVVHYTITEFNATDAVESPQCSAAPVEVTLESGSGHTGVVIDFSGLTPINADTTHWRVYRNASGLSPQEVAFLFDVAIADSQATDTGPFNIVGNQPYDYLTVGGITYDVNTPPPIFRKLRYFRGSMVGLLVSNPRAMQYSVAGSYESWPVPYRIERFPLARHQELLDCWEVGSSLVFVATESLIRLDRLPRIVAGQFIGDDPVTIAGAPGGVGEECAVVVPFGGEQHLAWISHYGVFVTNGHQYLSIDGPIDWLKWRRVDKTNWVLEWDDERKALVLAYSETGAANDRYWLIHLDNLREDRQPKWTGPHYGHIRRMISGDIRTADQQDGDTHMLYSGHTGNGVVYLEDNPDTGLDESNAYDANGTNPLDIYGRKIYTGNWTDFAVHDVRMRTEKFTSGEFVTVEWGFGRHATKRATLKTKNIKLRSDGINAFDISRSGEYHEFRLMHTEESRGAIEDMIVRVDEMGDTEAGL